MPASSMRPFGADLPLLDVEALVAVPEVRHGSVLRVRSAVEAVLLAFILRRVVLETANRTRLGWVEREGRADAPEHGVALLVRAHGNAKEIAVLVSAPDIGRVQSRNVAEQAIRVGTPLDGVWVLALTPGGDGSGQGGKQRKGDGSEEHDDLGRMNP